MNHRAFDHVLLGCGLSGSLCLIELLRTHSLPQRIAVFEANPHQLFRGKAYAADVSVQVLNVHADQMSLYWDDPLHFVRWLADQNLPYGPHDFVPRSLFGAYLEHSVKQALNQATGHTVSFFFEKVQGSVHVLGPPRKGTDWESTAMREIRAQVQSEVGRLI